MQPHSKTASRQLLKTVFEGALSALPTRAAIRLGYLMSHRRFPRIDHPVTFNEKIEHRKLFDRDSRLPGLADKILAKQHVAEVLGPEWVVPTIWHGTELPPRPDRTWPIPYALKASHGSGWNLFIRSREAEAWDEIERTAARWLRTAYGTATKEWAYSMIQPGLLVEPYLGDGDRKPNDYKVLVFGGVGRLIGVDTGGPKPQRYFYDRNWNRQSFEVARPGIGEVPPPRSLEKMLWAAERLGASFPFVRVDFYEIDERPLFGEMTFYPGGGRLSFKPKSADLELGRLWPM